MNEASFSRQFMQAWADHDPAVYYHKIGDVPISRVSGMRFNKPKAVDYMACFRGKFVAIEWKFINKGQSVNFDRLRPLQVETLQKVRDAGGVGLIIYGVYENKKSFLFAFTIDEFLTLSRQQLIIGKKSIKMFDLDKYRMDRIHAGGNRQVWDLDKFQTAIIEGSVE